MQEQIGVRVDQLVAQDLDVGLTGLVRRGVTRRAADLGEQLSPAPDVVVIDIPHRRHGQRPAVEGHRGQPIIGQFRRSSVRRAAALRLSLGAVFLRMQRRRDPDVTVERPRHLLFDGGDVRLPPEPSDHERSRPGIPHGVDSSRDAVTVGIIRVGERDDRRFGDRFEQTHPDHLRSEAGADHQIVGRRPEGEVGQVVARREEFEGLAVGVRTLDGRRTHAHRSLGRHLEH